jgi:3-hydroxyacyl-[acyl-carrier-protein] dehydratase
MKPNLLFLNSLYTIENFSEKKEENKITAELSLNPAHEIFKGHFPGNPVLPGVCTVEIIIELISYYLKQNIRLIKAQNIKYLSFINPETNSKICVDITIRDAGNGQLTGSATVYYGTTSFCSFKGDFAARAI